MGYELVVVGGGHAGIEAAHAAAGMGVKTLLITINLKTLGWMPCNPAIGGVSKGNLVVELDAMGGLMPRAADACGIQFRLLNRSKGPAVRGLRAQVDRRAYAFWMQREITSINNLDVREGTVTAVDVKEGRVKGVEISGGEKISCRAVVVTAGTFLRGLIHIGLEHFSAGREGEPPAEQLSGSLKEIGLSLGRLKTGTSPRVYRESIDFSILEKQDGEIDVQPFSLKGVDRIKEQVPCYITFTNEKVHQIIRNNIDQSPMYAGVIEGVGPRYCPSIEDKVMKFPHNKRHQIFIEPEGVDHPEVYVNGIATNMPQPIQELMVRAIRGLENAVIARPGYAIEYDFVYPTQLNHSLSVQGLQGLYLAGQINGTSGYEEAATLGFVAGVNAALKIRNEAPFTLRRDEAYIGVMIDDLVLKGVDEPYRMMTARAEFRLHLGYQTAYRRLGKYGKELGLVDGKTCEKVMKEEEKITERVRSLEEMKITPDARTREVLSRSLGIEIKKETSAAGLHRRMRGDIREILEVLGLDGVGDERFWERVSFDIIYKHYVVKQQRMLDEVGKWERLKIPEDMDYREIRGLSNEMVERLTAVRPGTLAQVMRTPGITPAAVTTIYVHLRPR